MGVIPLARNFFANPEFLGCMLNKVSVLYNAYKGISEVFFKALFLIKIVIIKTNPQFNYISKKNNKGKIETSSWINFGF